MSDRMLQEIYRLRRAFRDLSDMTPNVARFGMQAYNDTIAEFPKDRPWTGTVWGMRMILDSGYPPDRITVAYIAESPDV